MNIIAMTMVYNEGEQLARWLRYYQQQVVDVMVIDHGSDDGSTDGIRNRISLPRSPFDDGSRAEMITGLQNGLLQAFDAVIYTDCDEFIVADPKHYATLRDYITAMPRARARPIGFDIVHLHRTEPQLDSQKSILSQRAYVWMRSSMCKPLIVTEPTRWAAGFHACNAPVPIDPYLFLFHTKFADYHTALKRLSVTRSMEWSSRAIKAKWGVHQRQTDEWMTDRFDEAQHVLTAQGFAHNFPPKDEVERFNGNFKRLPDGMWESPGFNGAVYDIPERLRGVA